MNITLSCLVLVSASEVEESVTFHFFLVADKVHKTKYDVSDEGQSNL